MGEIEHAGTSKTMPAITEAEAVPAPIDETKDAGGLSLPEPIALPRTRTSEDAEAVAGEIAAEPTSKTYGTPGAADKIAGERGIRPITRPPIP